MSVDIGADSPTCMIHTGPRRLATIDQVGGRSVGKDMLCHLISSGQSYVHDTHWSSQACNHRPGWGQECGKGMLCHLISERTVLRA